MAEAIDARAGDQVVAPTQQDTWADRFLPSVQRFIWIAFILAIANGVFLYFFPALAEPGYAWPIRPPVSAALMGAGYLSGVLVTSLALFVVRYWRSIWGLFWPFFAVASAELLATIIHADRFRWDYWLTWVWTAVYIIIPPALVLLWITQQRVSHKQPPLDVRLAPVRTVFWVLGAIVTIFGLLLFIRPELFIPDWPWTLTPLLGRAFSAWYLQMGITLLFAAATLRQPHEAVIAYSWLTLINALFLLLPVLHASNMRADALLFWPWLALHLFLFAFAAWTSYRSYTLMRAEHQRL
jgi:hypothetical protein